MIELVETPRNEISIVTYNCRLSNAINITNNTHSINGRNHGKQESGGSITSVPSTSSSDKATRQAMIVYSASLSNKIDELQKLCDECGISVPENLQLHQQQLQLRKARFFKTYDRHKTELMFGSDRNNKDKNENKEETDEKKEYKVDDSNGNNGNSGNNGGNKSSNDTVKKIIDVL